MKGIIGILALILTLGLFSCNNTSDDVLTTNDKVSEKSAQVTLNEVKMEAAATESEYEVEFYANMEGLLWRWWKIGKHFQWSQNLRYRMNHCPDVRLQGGDEDGYPKVITLDYGDSTVLHNGTVLSGVIEITITAPRSSQDFERTVVYSEFGVDSMTIDGYATIIVDKVDSMYRQYTLDLTFTLADGTVINRTSERVWQWLEGMETMFDQSDDVFVINELSQAVMTVDGTTDTYKKETTVPLKRLGDCKYIVEGVVQITLNGVVISEINYGDGTCDELAVMTDAEGVETEIDLSARKFKGKVEQNQNSGKNQSGK
ncbi:hypothetical protein [Maribellus sediminis]|uniref:hypothetical protein n=1 Tax=Maribellus sediminis TaxID=2696285 RepID=UPI001430F7F8|nr:hypothetical protein [Maribellus sediminis]